MNQFLSQTVKYCKANPLYTILAISLLMQLAIVTLVGVMEWTDSPGYYWAADELAQGELDAFRTPVYPLFFVITGFISESLKLWLVALLQIVTFYISVVAFYKICKRLRLSVNIAIIATCVYAFCPRLLYNNMMMMTESFAVSVGVFMAYYFVKWLQDNDWKSYVAILLTAVFLVFIRPSFVYLPIALGIISIALLIIRHYRRGLQLLLCVGVVGGLLFGYCKMMELKYGVFTPSTVSIQNQYIIALNNGTFKSDNITNPKIKQRVLEFEENGSFRASIWEGPDLSGIDIKDLNNELSLLKSNKLAWYIRTVKSNLMGFMDSPVVSINEHNIFITFGQLCVILIVVFFALVIYIAKFKDVPVFSILLWLICVGNIFVNILGSYAEWARLFMPSLPIFILLCAITCNLFRLSLRHDKNILI